MKLSFVLFQLLNGTQERVGNSSEGVAEELFSNLIVVSFWPVDGVDQCSALDFKALFGDSSAISDKAFQLPFTGSMQLLFQPMPEFERQFLIKLIQTELQNVPVSDGSRH